MILGHYGVALAAKRVAPATSLATLAFAAQWLDELWPILLLLGVERARVVPGLMPANQIEFVHYPYSHSLLAAVLWGALIGGAYYARRGYRTGALTVGVMVLSHWLLDAPMHGPDLPLWPGSEILIGGGLWNFVALTVLVDGGVFIAGLLVYLRSTRARDRVGSWGLWAMVGLLVAILASGVAGPPPESDRALAVTALGLWLFVPWSAWVDRHREPSTVAPGSASALGATHGSR